MKSSFLIALSVWMSAATAMAAAAPHVERVTYDPVTGAAVVVASVPRGQRVSAEHTDLLVSASVGYVAADAPMSLVESRSLLLRAATPVASPANGSAWFAVEVPLANRPDLSVPFEVDVALPGLVGAGKACPDQCSGHGACAYGKCFCDSGWVGDTCSQSTVCPGECNGHGICAYGKCICAAGFEGAACDQPIPAPCPNQCNDRGICIHGKCACVEGFTGEDCSVRVEPDPCPNQCTGRGICIHGKCACDPGFTGDDCSVAVDACPNDCSGRGECRRGLCFCDPGFGGVDCSGAPDPCPNQCSGQGVCAFGRCFCDAGFTGDDCSAPVDDCPRCAPAPN
jgi:hypothetical protein